MAKLIQNFCHKVTKSLDSNELKYMNDSKFDILIEHLKPDNKLLLPISDGKIENKITDDGIDTYYMQGFVDGNGNMHGPYSSDNLDVSNDNHDNDNDHTDSNESVIESYFENEEEQNDNSNNDVYLFNGGIDDHKGSRKKADTKSLKSMANSNFTSNTAPSSHFSKHLRPFKINKNGHKTPVFDPERTQRLYASADLTLNKLESILLRSFLIRLSDKLYSKEPIFGILNSEKSFENTNDRIKDNYHVFLKYDYLKNVMEWEDNEACSIKNRESRYSTDFYKQVPLAFSHFANEENNTNSFKNYWYYKINDFNNLKKLKKSRSKKEKKNLIDKKKRDDIFTFETGTTSKVSPTTPNCPKKSDSKNASHLNITKTNFQVPKRSSSRTSFPSAENTPKAISSKLLRQKSIERAKSDSNFLSDSQKSFCKSKNLSIESFSVPRMNLNGDSPSLTPNFLAPQPPLVPLPYGSGDNSKQETKEESLPIPFPRAASPSDDIEVHADDEMSTSSTIHVYPKTKNVSIPKNPLSSLPFKFFGSYAERGNNTIENILLGDILEEKYSSQEDIAEDPENNFINLYHDYDDDNLETNEYSKFNDDASKSE